MKKKSFRDNSKKQSPKNKAIAPKPVRSWAVPENKIIPLPKEGNAKDATQMDFTDYYGKGCDEFIAKCQELLTIWVASSIETKGAMHSIATLHGYHVALKKLIEYLSALVSVSDADLTLKRETIDGYIHYLASTELSYQSQKSIYTCNKSVLKGLQSKGWIDKFDFPKNPYPGSNRKGIVKRPYSKQVVKQIVRAIASECREMVNSETPLDGYQLSVCLLAISLRSGLNKTPLLELTTSALQPHPVKDDRNLLVSYKRRGNATNIKSLRGSQEVEELACIMGDIASVFELVKKRNAYFRARSELSNLLWIYESKARVNSGEVTWLSSGTLASNLTRFVKLHSITDDDGKPLNISLQRIRKTYLNRMYELSGYDPVLTAELGNHSETVSNNHYMEAPKEAKRNFKLLGEIYVKTFTGKTENTPSGRCKDTKNGHLAPKNGKYCTDFLACFRCRSYVVTGDDLYRVFSLYWMLVRERAKIGIKGWDKAYRYFIHIINNEIAPKFDASLVEAQREKARMMPHPAWREPEILNEAAL